MYDINELSAEEFKKVFGPIVKVTTKPKDGYAVRLTEENLETVAEWCYGTVVRSPLYSRHRYIRLVATNDQGHYPDIANVGNWIVTHMHPNFQVYRGNTFENTFDFTIQIGE